MLLIKLRQMPNHGTFFEVLGDRDHRAIRRQIQLAGCQNTAAHQCPGHDHAIMQNLPDTLQLIVCNAQDIVQGHNMLDENGNIYITGLPKPPPQNVRRPSDKNGLGGS